MINIKDLKTWESNYNEGDVGAIAVSIRRFGFRGALRVWRDNVVMAGNHTLLALWSLKAQGPVDGFDYAPVGIVEQGGNWYLRDSQIIDLSDLDYTEATAFAIADNEIARRATRDSVQLSRLLVEINKHDPALLAPTSFAPEDLDDLLADISHPSLDGLAEEFGEPDDKDFWPLINIQVSPETHDRFITVMAQIEAENDYEKMAILLEAVDEELLGSELS